MKTYARYGGISKSYVCPVCGTLFLVPYQSKGGGRMQWVYRKRYKGKMAYFCSYHCFKNREVKVNDGANT